MSNLSFKEKRQLQKAVRAQLDVLAGEGLGFKAKREAQKALREALQKLKESIADDSLSIGYNPIYHEELAKLASGEYNGLGHMEFRAKVEEIGRMIESVGDSIEPLKQPVIDYIHQQAA